MSLFEEHGFRPQIVQEAPQWLTIMRLVGAGLGVSVGPACTRQIAGADIACPGLRGARVASDIELAYRESEDRAVVAAFAAVARKSFGHATDLSETKFAKSATAWKKAASAQRRGRLERGRIGEGRRKPTVSASAPVTLQKLEGRIWKGCQAEMEFSGFSRKPSQLLLFELCLVCCCAMIDIF